MILIDQGITREMLNNLKPGDNIAIVFHKDIVGASPVIDAAQVKVNGHKQLLIERRPKGQPRRLLRWSKITNKPVGQMNSRAGLYTIKEHSHV
jgi:hypothetical protein